MPPLTSTTFVYLTPVRKTHKLVTSPLIDYTGFNLCEEFHQPIYRPRTASPSHRSTDQRTSTPFPTSLLAHIAHPSTLTGNNACSTTVCTWACNESICITTLRCWVYISNILSLEMVIVLSRILWYSCHCGDSGLYFTCYCFWITCSIDLVPTCSSAAACRANTSLCIAILSAVEASIGFRSLTPW